MFSLCVRTEEQEGRTKGQSGDYAKNFPPVLGVQDESL
jgi:hypothetical protein